MEILEGSSTPNDVRLFPLPQPYGSKARMVAVSPKSQPSENIPIPKSEDQSEAQLALDEAMARCRDQAMFHRIYRSKGSSSTSKIKTSKSPVFPTLVNMAAQGYVNAPPPATTAAYSWSTSGERFARPGVHVAAKAVSVVEDDSDAEGIFELEL